MARRAGKAASRKARQRYVPKTPRPAATPAPEVTSVDRPATIDDAPIEAPTAEPRRRSAPVAYATTGSTLTLRERAEYHYVERDLRNIGILSLVMAVLLVAAYFVFNALGVIG
jgi:hypothetical protein